MLTPYVLRQVVTFYKVMFSAEMVEFVACPGNEKCNSNKVGTSTPPICFKAALEDADDDGEQTQSINEILGRHMTNLTGCNECLKQGISSQLANRTTWLIAPEVFLLFLGRERVSTCNKPTVPEAATILAPTLILC